jgi:uncharacterized protein (DUF1810 family)
VFAHFLAAQDPVFATVLAELRSGEKRTHWIWFIFPQLRALGRSPTALKYGLRDLAEAQAYLNESVLGARLVECIEAAMAVDDRTAYQIFGSPDDAKLHSSLTLFRRAALASGRDTAIYDRALSHFYNGIEDARTREILDY